MKRIKLLAQLAMDLYYKDFAKDSDFFTLEDFTQYCSMFYYAILQEEFDKSIIKNIKTNNQPYPVINDSWFEAKEFSVKKDETSGKYFIDIKELFSFSNDSFNSSIKIVLYPGDNCIVFNKISIDKLPTLKFLPKSDKSIYYYQVQNKLHFEKYCLGNKKVSLKVLYIPTLNEIDENQSFNVPPALLSEIVIRCYNLFSNSRNGSVIDKTNNQNPNKVIQTEIAS